MLQPVEPVRGTGTVARADVVLVPALAVDVRGRRSGVAAGRTTGRWPGWDPRCRRSRCSMTPSCCLRCPRKSMTRRFARWRGLSRGSRGCPPEEGRRNQRTLCTVILSSLLARVLILRTELAPPGGSVPTYQYVCTECGDQVEAVQKFTDDPLSVHDICGGRLRKVFSPVGIVFKGSGFYRTDSLRGRRPRRRRRPRRPATPRAPLVTRRPVTATRRLARRSSSSSSSTSSSSSSGSSSSGSSSGSSGEKVA